MSRRRALLGVSGVVPPSNLVMHCPLTTDANDIIMGTVGTITGNTYVFNSDGFNTNNGTNCIDFYNLANFNFLGFTESFTVFWECKNTASGTVQATFLLGIQNIGNVFDVTTPGNSLNVITVGTWGTGVGELFPAPYPIYFDHIANMDIWRKMALTFDATTKLIQLYVNGVMLRSGTMNNIPNLTTNRMSLGGRYYTPAIPIANVFRGNIRDFKLFNTVLTQQEIGDL